MINVFRGTDENTFSNEITTRIRLAGVVKDGCVQVEAAATGHQAVIRDLKGVDKKLSANLREHIHQVRGTGREKFHGVKNMQNESKNAANIPTLDFVVVADVV